MEINDYTNIHYDAETGQWQILKWSYTNIPAPAGTDPGDWMAKGRTYWPRETSLEDLKTQFTNIPQDVWDELQRLTESGQGAYLAETYRYTDNSMMPDSISGYVIRIPGSTEEITFFPPDWNPSTQEAYTAFELPEKLANPFFLEMDELREPLQPAKFRTTPFNPDDPELYTEPHYEELFINYPNNEYTYDPETGIWSATIYGDARLEDGGIVHDVDFSELPAGERPDLPENILDTAQRLAKEYGHGVTVREVPLDPDILYVRMPEPVYEFVGPKGDILGIQQPGHDFEPWQITLFEDYPYPWPSSPFDTPPDFDLKIESGDTVFDITINPDGSIDGLDIEEATQYMQDRGLLDAIEHAKSIAEATGVPISISLVEQLLDTGAKGEPLNIGNTIKIEGPNGEVSHNHVYNELKQYLDDYDPYYYVWRPQDEWFKDLEYKDLHDEFRQMELEESEADWNGPFLQQEWMCTSFEVEEDTLAANTDGYTVEFINLDAINKIEEASYESDGNDPDPSLNQFNI